MSVATLASLSLAIIADFSLIEINHEALLEVDRQHTQRLLIAEPVKNVEQAEEETAIVRAASTSFDAIVDTTEEDKAAQDNATASTWFQHRAKKTRGR